jgi:hypothetical protein
MAPQTRTLATAGDTPPYRLAAGLVYDALDHQHFYRLAVEDSERSMHALLPAIPHLVRLRELDLSQLSSYEPRGEQVTQKQPKSNPRFCGSCLYKKRRNGGGTRGHAAQRA